MLLCQKTSNIVTIALMSAGTGPRAAGGTGSVDTSGTVAVLSKIKLRGSTASQLLQIAAHSLAELKKNVDETESRYAPFFGRWRGRGGKRGGGRPQGLGN